MQPFITSVLTEILKREGNISDHTFILPSKRAGSYLKNQLSKLVPQSMFAPNIFSIEDFIEEISGLNSMDNTATLFRFYSIYKKLTPAEEIEDFDTFSSWAQTLIYDFNEIDRYLVDGNNFFNYLSEIQDINHWYLQEEKTELIKNYLSFWHSLPKYYEELKKQMLEQGEAYQGFIFRKAAENASDYVKQIKTPHVFLGFNALNTAEQVIIQEFLKSEKAEVFWDAEKTFLEDNFHDASYFLREYFKSWPYYQENPVKNITNFYSEEKNIQQIGIPKNIGQAKYVGELLSKMSLSEIEKTAVVLGDEGLLLPLLSSLPANVGEVNITMGFPLKYAPISSLFEQLFNLHINYREKFYYKDVLAIFNHPVIQHIWKNETKNIVYQIQKQNLAYISLEEIKQQTKPEAHELVNGIFSDLKNSAADCISHFKKIIFIVREEISKTEDKILMETLFSFHKLFSKLENLSEAYPHIQSVKTLFNLYKDLVSTTTLDFRGQPFKGLQIMGMLESRVLDFERVIVTSVNEGVLPAGKSANSFIPFDLKKAYNLPTYKEKDAVYTYHFYSLIQRAQDVKLLYNTEPGGLNAGEKSRFLIQLEVEKQPKHNLEKTIVSPQVPKVFSELKQVEKTPEILEKIKYFAGRGFSPSALTTYMRNPLDFYTQYILGIRETEEVEETVAANTLGTVVHNTLENFYKPLAEDNIPVTKEFLKTSMDNTAKEVAKQFQDIYTKAPLNKGKNLLIFEVAKRYVNNFLKAENAEIELGNKTKILQIEADLKKEIEVEGLDFPVYIRGKVDRIDDFNGTTRIIDYKTGKVMQNQLEISNWEEITTDYDKYSKPFQVLAYATMMSEQISFPVEAGVFSFKNMQSGFLKFTEKEGRNKKTLIDKETMEAFHAEISRLIFEICNPDVPFTEKEIKQKSW